MVIFLLRYILALKLVQICSSWDLDKGKWSGSVIFIAVFLVSWTENSCEEGGKKKSKPDKFHAITGLEKEILRNESRRASLAAQRSCQGAVWTGGFLTHKLWASRRGHPAAPWHQRLHHCWLIPGSRHRQGRTLGEEGPGGNPWRDGARGTCICLR